MMEVLRILKATGPQAAPHRFASGSGAPKKAACSDRGPTSREHLGTREAAEAGAGEDTSAYFNLDNGTGKIRGIWMQSNTAVKPIFEAWIAPLKDLGVEILGPRSVASDRPHALRRRRRAGVPVRAGALRVQLAHAPLEHGLLRSRAGRRHEADGDRRRRVRLAGGESRRSCCRASRCARRRGSSGAMAVMPLRQVGLQVRLLGRVPHGGAASGRPLFGGRRQPTTRSGSSST